MQPNRKESSYESQFSDEDEIEWGLVEEDEWGLIEEKTDSNSFT